MRRCFTLAANGLGKVAPNPMVGCVIVHNGEIIGEGYHRQYGGAHAEVNAINSVPNDKKHLLRESTVYVSLEPCNHFGKTPPCADLLVQNQVKKVVIAMQDPFAKVNGTGIQKLRDNNIEIEVGILEDEAKTLIKRFIIFHQQKRPYIILKWAQTQNGFIGQANKQVWITNALCKKLSHKWRNEEAAIFAGPSTINIDNPQLTNRLWYGKNPIRITYDWKNNLNPQANIFNTEAPTILFNKQTNKDLPKHITQIQLENESVETMLTALHQQNIQSVIIEGGAKTLQQFINANLWDEARILIGNQTWDEGVKAPSLNYEDGEKIVLGNNTVYIKENPAKALPIAGKN